MAGLEANGDPVIAMNDVRCRVCGEPYEVYSLHHDIPDWDDAPDNAYEVFMNGGGCPTCSWGENPPDDVNQGFQEKDAGERKVEQVRDIMRNTDDDPMKYL